MSQTCCYDYICVIDFEATCIKQDNKKLFYPHEIIEFPCVLIDVGLLEILFVEEILNSAINECENLQRNTFHAYVRPTLNPELSEFCKSLTGITQESVSNAETFDYVLNDFMDFIKNHIEKEKTYIVLCDGNWDISRFLALQCLITNIDFPSWANNWIDLKKVYGVYHKNPCKAKLETMLHSHGLKLEGRLHSGIDDAHNIARLVIKMMEGGCIFASNDSISALKFRRLRNELSAYLKAEKTRKSHKNKRNAAEQLERDCFLEVDSEMDIDPDLIGCEHILLKNKV